MEGLNKAAKFAIKVHDVEANQKYGEGLPYSYHLAQVRSVAYQFKHLIPEEFHEQVFAACWLHDTIEDARQTYNDIKKEFGEEVADIVYALTNEKGRNRKERANYKYYAGIRETRFAPFVKMCDRIANVKYSQSSGSKMFAMYHKENGEFLYNLAQENTEMGNYLSSIFNEL